MAHSCKGTLGDKTPQSSDSADPTVHMSVGNSPDLSPQERELPPRNAQQSLENSSTKQVCQVCKCHVHRSALKELCIGSLQTRHHVVRAVNAHPQELCPHLDQAPVIKMLLVSRATPTLSSRMSQVAPERYAAASGN